MVDDPMRFGLPPTPDDDAVVRAADRFRDRVDVQRPDGAVNSRGCSGLSYFVEYADEQKKFEDMVEDKGVRIYVDPASTMFLIGSQMDYVEDKLQSGFVFTNPNEKSRCGCGERLRAD